MHLFKQRMEVDTLTKTTLLLLLPHLRKFTVIPHPDTQAVHTWCGLLNPNPTDGFSPGHSDNDVRTFESGGGGGGIV